MEGDEESLQYRRLYGDNTLPFDGAVLVLTDYCITVGSKSALVKEQLRDQRYQPLVNLAPALIQFMQTKPKQGLALAKAFGMGRKREPLPDSEEYNGLAIAGRKCTMGLIFSTFRKYLGEKGVWRRAKKELISGIGGNPDWRLEAKAVDASEAIEMGVLRFVLSNDGQQADWKTRIFHVGYSSERIRADQLSEPQEHLLFSTALPFSPLGPFLHVLNHDPSAASSLDSLEMVFSFLEGCYLSLFVRVATSWNCEQLKAQFERAAFPTCRKDTEKFMHYFIGMAVEKVQQSFHSPVFAGYLDMAAQKTRLAPHGASWQEAQCTIDKPSSSTGRPRGSAGSTTKDGEASASGAKRACQPLRSGLLVSHSLPPAPSTSSKAQGASGAQCDLGETPLVALARDSPAITTSAFAAPVDEEIVGKKLKDEGPFAAYRYAYGTDSVPLVCCFLVYTMLSEKVSLGQFGAASDPKSLVHEIYGDLDTQLVCLIDEFLGGQSARQGSILARIYGFGEDNPVPSAQKDALPDIAYAMHFSQLAFFVHTALKYLDGDTNGWERTVAEVRNGTDENPHFKLKDTSAADACEQIVGMMLENVAKRFCTNWAKLMFSLCYSKARILASLAKCGDNIKGLLCSIPWSPWPYFKLLATGPFSDVVKIVVTLEASALALVVDVSSPDFPVPPNEVSLLKLSEPILPKVRDSQEYFVYQVTVAGYRNMYQISTRNPNRQMSSAQFYGEFANGNYGVVINRPLPVYLARLFITAAPVEQNMSSSERFSQGPNAQEDVKKCRPENQEKLEIKGGLRPGFLVAGGCGKSSPRAASVEPTQQKKSTSKNAPLSKGGFRPGFLIGAGKPVACGNESSPTQPPDSTREPIPNIASGFLLPKEGKGMAKDQPSTSRNSRDDKRNAAPGAGRNWSRYSLQDAEAVIAKYRGIHGVEYLPLQFDCSVVVDRLRPRTGYDDLDANVKRCACDLMLMSAVDRLTAELLEYTDSVNRSLSVEDLFLRFGIMPPLENGEDKIVIAQEFRKLQMSCLFAYVSNYVLKSVVTGESFRDICGRICESARWDFSDEQVEACVFYVLEALKTACGASLLDVKEMSGATKRLCTHLGSGREFSCRTTSATVWGRWLPKCPWSASMWLLYARAAFRERAETEPSCSGSELTRAHIVSALMHGCCLALTGGSWADWNFKDLSTEAFRLQDYPPVPKSPFLACFVSAGLSQAQMYTARCQGSAVQEDDRDFDREHEADIFTKYHRVHGGDPAPFDFGILSVLGSLYTVEDLMDGQVVEDEDQNPSTAFNGFINILLKAEMEKSSRSSVLKKLVCRAFGLSSASGGPPFGRLDKPSLLALLHTQLSCVLSSVAHRVREAFVKFAAGQTDWSSRLDGLQAEFVHGYDVSASDYDICRTIALTVMMAATLVQYPDYPSLLRQNSGADKEKISVGGNGEVWLRRTRKTPWNPFVWLSYSGFLHNRAKKSNTEFPISCFLAFTKSCILSGYADLNCSKPASGSQSVDDLCQVIACTLTKAEPLLRDFFSRHLEVLRSQLTAQHVSLVTPSVECKTTKKKGRNQKKRRNHYPKDGGIERAESAMSSTSYYSTLPPHDAGMLTKACGHVQAGQSATSVEETCKYYNLAALIYQRYTDQIFDANLDLPIGAKIEVVASLAYTVLWNEELSAKEHARMQKVIDYIDQNWKSSCRVLFVILRSKLHIRLLDYEEAENCVDAVRRILGSGAKFESVSYPCSELPIPGSTPEGAPKELSGLEAFLRCPPGPDLVCRSLSCAKSDIHYNAIGFDGYVRLYCSNQCNVTYHNSCMLGVLTSVGANEMKQIRSPKPFKCPTPDCQGTISCIEVYTASVILKTSFQPLKQPAKPCARQDPDSGGDSEEAQSGESEDESKGDGAARQDASGNDSDSLGSCCEHHGEDLGSNGSANLGPCPVHGDIEDPRGDGSSSAPRTPSATGGWVDCGEVGDVTEKQLVSGLESVTLTGEQGRGDAEHKQVPEYDPLSGFEAAVRDLPTHPGPVPMSQEGPPAGAAAGSSVSRLTGKRKRKAKLRRGPDGGPVSLKKVD